MKRLILAILSLQMNTIFTVPGIINLHDKTVIILCYKRVNLGEFTDPDDFKEMPFARINLPRRHFFIHIPSETTTIRHLNPKECIEILDINPQRLEALGFKPAAQDLLKTLPINKEKID